MAAKKFNLDDNYYDFDEAHSDVVNALIDLEGVLNADLHKSLDDAAQKMFDTYSAAHNFIDEHLDNQDTIADLQSQLTVSEKEAASLLKENDKLTQAVDVLKARLQLNGLSTSTKQTRTRREQRFDECDY